MVLIPGSSVLLQQPATSKQADIPKVRSHRHLRFGPWYSTQAVTFGNTIACAASREASRRSFGSERMLLRDRPWSQKIAEICCGAAFSGELKGPDFLSSHEDSCSLGASQDGPAVSLWRHIFIGLHPTNVKLKEQPSTPRYYRISANEPRKNCTAVRRSGRRTNPMRSSRRDRDKSFANSKTQNPAGTLSAWRG